MPGGGTSTKMSLDAAGLALLSAIAWGSSSGVSKLGMEAGGTPFQAALTNVSVSLVVFVTVIVARGESIRGFTLFAIALFAVTGLLATAVARVLSYTGVQRVGASVNGAAINTRPVFAALGAVVFLGETVQPSTAIGIAMVVAGLITLAISRGGDVSGWRRSDLVFPLGAALLYGSGSVLRRYGFTHTDMTTIVGVAINETAGLAGLLLFVLVYRSDDVGAYLSAPRSAYAYFVGIGLLNAVALFALFEALSRGRVVIVDPLSSTTSLFTIAFVGLFLKDVEVLTKRLVLGAVLVVLGVVLVTASELAVL